MKDKNKKSNNQNFCQKNTLYEKIVKGKWDDKFDDKEILDMIYQDFGLIKISEIFDKKALDKIREDIKNIEERKNDN